MRFHILGLPHTKFTDEFSFCAYTQKARRLRDMLRELNHDVFTYEGDGWGDGVRMPDANPEDLNWVRFNERCIEELGPKSQPGDFICVTYGNCQRPVIEAYRHLTAVETGVGYSGLCTDFRVFESYAWMHAVYAGRAGDAMNADGEWYDTVIPNAYHEYEFTQGRGDGDYLLYIGRNTARKGVDVARKVADRVGMKLVTVGPGFDRVVGPEERNELMGSAVATLVPTQYIAPFEGVHVESMLTGTPVLTTDWGVFTETVENGVNGYRCRNLRDFVFGVNFAKRMDRERIRSDALSRYSTRKVKYMYDDYFRRLNGLRTGGWDA